MSGFGTLPGKGGTVNVEQIQGLEAFDISKTYAAGNNVKEGGRIWESLQNNNLGHIPSADNALAPVWWKEISTSHLQNTDTGTDKAAWNIGAAFTTGAARILQAVGSALNIDLELRPKGTGKIKLPTYTNTDERLLSIKADKTVVSEKITVPLFVAAPTSLPNFPGIKGQEAYDSLYYYVCIEDNTWVRYFLGNRDYVNLVTSVPPTLTSAGVQGQIAFDVNYRYECFAPNQWYRFPHNKDVLEMYVGVPVTMTSAGIKGQMSEDANFIYYCVAPNTWVKVTKVSSRSLFIGSDTAGTTSTIQADGTGADIDLILGTKGTGYVRLPGGRYVVPNERVVTLNVLGQVITQYDVADEFIAVPPTLASAGIPGQKAYDNTWLYYCVAANTWVRFLPESNSLAIADMYVAIPPTPTSEGRQGQRAYDNVNNLMYECVAANVWVRYAIVKTW